MSETSERVALLLAENDRLRVRCRQIDDEAYDYAQQIEQQKAEIDRLHLANKDAIDHYTDARAEIDRLRAAIARVRARHYSIRSYDYDEDAQFCKECGADFPCPTLRILDGDA